MAETYSTKSIEQSQVDAWFGDEADKMRALATPLWSVLGQDDTTINEFIYQLAPESFAFQSPLTQKDRRELFERLVIACQKEHSEQAYARMEESLIVAFDYAFSLDDEQEQVEATEELHTYAFEYLLSDDQINQVMDKAR